MIVIYATAASDRQLSLMSSIRNCAGFDGLSADDQRYEMAE
jgi:hypothetical protein